MRVVAAYMTARRGASADARAMCDDLIDEFADDAIPASDVPARLVILSDVCRLCDHRSGMEECVTRLLPHSGHQAVFPYSQYWGSVDLAIGKLYRDMDRPDDAVDYLGRAEEQGRRVNAVLYEHQAQRLLAELGVDGVGRRS